MTSPPINGQAARRHTHTAIGSAGEDTERCPWCGSEISRSRFSALQRKIAEQERERLGKVEQTLKAQFVTAQQQAAAKAKTEIEKALKDAAALVAKAKRGGAAREAAIKQQATQAAMAALAPKISEAVNAEKARGYAERQKMTEELDRLKARLEQRRANELGDEAELDLYEALRREFPGDQIARVPKGRNGADILHDVMHHGVVVGRLVLDSKNHGRWSSTFASKIASDLITHRGDHAIVSSNVMPAGVRQPFHLVDGVIVAQPARLVVLVTLLRRHVIAMHLKAGNLRRDGKRDELYAFIASERCTQLLDRIGSLTNTLSGLDEKEESAHRTVWKRRTELIRSIQGIHSEFTAEIETILGRAPVEASS
jgi:hypothetical protein